MKRYNTLPRDAQSWDLLDIAIEVKLQDEYQFVQVQHTNKVFQSIA
jgi:hypothetical protein